jgi:hypothetical protein
MQKKFDDTNRGVLFKSDRKDKPDDRDYHGEFTDAGGQEFWISGWAKTSKKGAKYLSLAFKPKNEQPDKPPFSDDVGLRVRKS